MIIPCAAIKFPLRLKELSACTKQPIETYGVTCFLLPQKHAIIASASEERDSSDIFLDGKEAASFMPLVIVTVFFILLFSCEGIDHASREMDNQQALRRYREHEHRTRHTSDRYLDLLG